jgi:penicillin-binding protein 1C
LKRIVKILTIAAGVIIAPVLFSPMPRFRAPLSTVVEGGDGSILGARIADDGQWRFPAEDEVPEKFEKSILAFEDRWFWYHPGVNPVSLVRALVSNTREGRIVSGGSTITMQVARLSAGNRERSYLNKLLEIMSAVKLELFRSKREILRMYAANAPFGGNTIGLGAAAVRYTGKPPSSLSWAEAAALAVLPNSPGLVFPGKNQEILRTKRDNLLRKLYRMDCIDSLTLVLSLDEPLIYEPETIPSIAPHLTDYFYRNRKGQVTVTTIDPFMQERATEIINSHQKDLAGNFIFNSACIIAEVKTGHVLAYIGNSSVDGSSEHGGNVDIIRSLRSTGSILKPFLYAAMQQSGDILPNSLVPDVPTRFPGFSPKNFDQTYSGAVPAGYALSQSLNIPAVKMLRKYNPENFLNMLRNLGFTTFGKPADYYGLSLILGGGETSLWELAGVYANLSRVLGSYNSTAKYYSEDYHSLVLSDNNEHKKDTLRTEDSSPVLSASAIWLTYEALQKVNRPDSETGWQYFSSSPGFAWKTGTSFGFRDAWAVGTTPGYVIAVWVGNAGGEGRPGLTGTAAAAPLLFDLAGLVPKGDWFEMPAGDMTSVTVCKESGFRAGPFCNETEEIFTHVNGLRSETCPYHRLIHLDAAGMQVSSDCESPENIRNISWFVLPPAMEYYYRQKHSEYKALPPVKPGCGTGKDIPVMEFIYPTPGVKIFIPRDQSGQLTRVIAEVAHRNPSTTIYWHLDDKYSASTRSIHQLEILAGKGIHVLTAVDDDGNMIKCEFEVE